MATNGASARQWLAENGSGASLEALQRIRDAIAGKLDALAEEHPDEDGLLEALDVMDDWINSRHGSTQQAEPAAASLPVLDTGPLIPDLPPAEQLSPEEKQARFRALLQNGRTTGTPAA